MSLLIKGVGSPRKRVTYLAPCRFTGYATDCWRFYSNYLKKIADSATANEIPYYSNYLKEIADAHLIHDVPCYSNHIKSLNGFFLPVPSTTYEVV